MVKLTCEEKMKNEKSPDISDKLYFKTDELKSVTKMARILFCPEIL